MRSPDLRPHLHAFDASEPDYQPLLDLVGGAQIVLLGEASHGTHDFYEHRARITRRLITEKGFSAVAVEGTDQVFGNTARMSLGYSLGRPTENPSDSSTAFGWSGVGGSHASADTATGTALAVTKNRFTSADFSTAAHIADVVTKALGER